MSEPKYVTLGDLLMAFLWGFALAVTLTGLSAIIVTSSIRSLERRITALEQKK